MPALLLALALALPPEANLILELDCPGDAWVNTVRENPDGSISLKITRARRDYGGECLWTDIRDFDFLTLSADGDTLGLTTHRSTDAYMLWDVLEMADGAGYLLYGDYRYIPPDMGEPDSDWYFNQTFPFSAFRVFRISLDGDTLWVRQWHEDSLANGLATRLLHDNSILTLAEERGPEGSRDALMVRMLESGVITWVQKIPDWDGIYPYHMAYNSVALLVVHGVDLNRHHQFDLETGSLLRVDTLPPEEPVYIDGSHDMRVGNLLVCRSENYASGPLHIGHFFGEGYGDDRIWLTPPLEELGPIRSVFAGCHIEGTSWAMVGNGGWDDPTIHFCLMDGFQKVAQTLALTGITGVPETELLEDWDVYGPYYDDIGWYYRPVGSLQYVGDGRFIMGITNDVMYAMSESVGFRLWVIELEIPGV
jgi:hypothetical protein